jgi:RNA polymerase sigma-54 factor
MAIQMHQTLQLRQQQQLVMTPQLQQAIKLLQLSRVELTEMVREELLENPLLEEAQELGSSMEEPISGLEMQDGVDVAADRVEASPNAEVDVERTSEPVSTNENSPEEPFDWERYLERDSLAGTAPSSGVRADDDNNWVEQQTPERTTLAEHLMWQVRLSRFSPVEESIAEFIVQNLSPAGYLRGVHLGALYAQTGFSSLQVEQVLRRVQQLDPLSIASRSLAEALWVQANNPDALIEDPLVLAIIARHLGDLESRAYPVIAKETGESLEEVYEATKVVMSLEPRPARSYVQEDLHYVVPDVYIQKVGAEYVVSLNDDGLPKLKISGLYRNAMHDGGDAKEYIAERLRSAQWLIRSIAQRQRTIVKVARSILKFQRDFFDKGTHFLRPLILKDVADDIEMHESTVSRVTSNKFVHTPQGVFELKYFFNAGITRHGGDDLASEAVKHRIKQLIDSEDVAHPHSDQRLVELLSAEGIEIARRTVAKYREQLNVASSSKRRKLF